MKKITKVIVRFPNSSQGYRYLSDIEGLEPYDHVVVQSHNTIALAQVHDLNVTDSSYIKDTDLKWVIQKVDMEAVREKSARFEEKRKLTRLLEQKVKDSDKTALLYILSQMDPEVKTAMDRLQELNKGEF